MNLVSNFDNSTFSPATSWYGAQRQLKTLQRDNDRDNGQHQRNYPHNDNRQSKAGHSYNIICKWEPFKEQIMLQWGRLTSQELDHVGPNRGKLAVLIENKYGIAAHLVENYLRNFERTLPLI